MEAGESLSHNTAPRTPHPWNRWAVLPAAEIRPLGCSAHPAWLVAEGPIAARPVGDPGAATTPTGPADDDPPTCSSGGDDPG